MDIQKIGNRIKHARTLRNYTLDDIASDIGVAKSTVQRYENSLITKPKLPVLQAIANSLKVNPSWLAGNDVPMEIEISSPDVLICKVQEEIQLMIDYRAQSPTNKQKTLRYAHMLAESDRMDTELKAAHERTDIKVTDEMRKHDDDIMNDPNNWK